MYGTNSCVRLLQPLGLQYCDIMSFLQLDKRSSKTFRRYSSERKLKETKHIEKKTTKDDSELTSRRPSSPTSEGIIYLVKATNHVLGYYCHAIVYFI